MSASRKITNNKSFSYLKPNRDRISRRDFIRKAGYTTVAGTLSFNLSCQTKSQIPVANKRKPNVIIIVSDDQGYGDIGIYGNTEIQTPNLDTLAKEGIWLTQHYSASPMCAPARASLLTGRYNHRTGAIDVPSNRGLDRISLREVTMADMFKTAGYATGMVGKWHNGLFDVRYHPNARGFDEFAGFLNGGMGYWKWYLDYNGRSHKSDGRYLTDVFTSEAINFINRHKNHPFFLCVSYNAPHLPLEAPVEDVAPFVGNFNETVSTIYGMIRRMDKGVGQIIDVLKRYGLTENTIILFTSDNGPVLEENCKEGNFKRYNGPFRGQKGEVFEGGIRVPAILRWPAGLPQNKEIHDMVHFIDWLPTLVSATGIKATNKLPFDGQNMLSVLQGQTNKANTKRFWQWNRYEPILNCNAAMRDGKWKLYWPMIPEASKKPKVDGEFYYRLFDEPHFLMEIDRTQVERDIPPPSKPQLYDLEADPGEQRNLSEKYPERTAKMKLELENWFESVEAERRTILQ